MSSAQIVRLKNQLAALWKFCLSFRKRDWELSDYPVMLRENKVDHQFSGTRFTQHRFVAYIVNWFVVGGGETAAEALRDLEIIFQRIKADREKNGTSPVRPGTSVSIEFAPQEQISEHQELSEDFIRRVLNLDWAWISDESRSLSDIDL